MSTPFSNKWLAKLCRKCRAPHFRHAKASHWIEDGLSIVEVQFLLGHEQIETTMKYLDITTAEKVRALATLENEKEKKSRKNGNLKTVP